MTEIADRGGLLNNSNIQDMTTAAVCDVFCQLDVLPSMTYKVQNNQASKQAIKQHDDIVAIAHAIVTKTVKGVIW